MKEMLLIRHGMTEGNVKNLYYGATDLPLSEQGKKALGELRDRGGYPVREGFRYFVTPLQRTHQSLHILFGDVPHEEVEGLREINFGVYEMHGYEELKDRPDYQTWITGDYLKNVPPEGESFEHMFHRVNKSFREVMSACDRAVFVIHGGPISAIMSTLFPPEDKNYYKFIPPCGKGFAICEKNGIMSYRAVPEETI